MWSQPNSYAYGFIYSLLCIIFYTECTGRIFSNHSKYSLPQKFVPELSHITSLQRRFSKVMVIASALYLGGSVFSLVMADEFFDSRRRGGGDNSEKDYNQTMMDKYVYTIQLVVYVLV